MLNDNSQAKVFVAGALWFSTVVIITFCAVFENSLFLSSYPVQYIPYYMITSVPVLFFSVLLISPILAEASNRLLILILVIAMVIVGAVIFMLQFSLYWFPFALRLLLAVVKATLTIISMSVISSSMSIREFKQKFGTIAVGGSLGGIVAGYLAMPITKIFGLESLLYFVILTFLSCICFIRLLPAKVAKQKSRTKKKSSTIGIRQYPLALWIMVLSVLMVFMMESSGFILQATLSHELDRNQIASFMGILLATVNVLTIFVQLSNKRIIEFSGLFGLMLSACFVCFPFSTFVFILPGLVAAAPMEGFFKIISYGTYGPGFQMLLNALPEKIRKLTLSYGKAISQPIGVFSGAGLALIATSLFEYQGSLRFIAVFMLLDGLVFLYVLKRVIAYYRTTLEDAIRNKLYSINYDEPLPGMEHSIYNMAIQSLQREDESAVQLGLSLLRRLKAEWNYTLSDLPEVMWRHIYHPSANIRNQTIKLVSEHPSEDIINALITQLNQESEPLILQTLLEALIQLSPKEAISYTKGYIDSDVPEKRAGAIQLYLAVGTIDDILLALNQLRHMLASDDVSVKSAAVRALGNIQLGDPDNLVSSYLSGEDALVTIQAIRVVKLRGVQTLIPQLIDNLGVNHVSYYVEKCLVSFGLGALKYFDPVFKEDNIVRMRAALRCLEHMDEGIEYEHFLNEKNDHDNLRIRTMVSLTLLKRAVKYPVSDELRNTARGKLLRLSNQLTTLLHLQRHEFPDYVKNEATVKLGMCVIRFLCWLGVYSNAKTVSDMMGNILPVYSGKAPGSEFYMSIEVLESLISDKEVRSIMKIIALESKEETYDIEKEIKHIKDTDLIRLIQYANSDNASKLSPLLITLRQVKIFDRLPLDEIELVHQSFSERVYKAGKTIFSEGDESDGLYVVTKGEVLLKGETVNAKMERFDYFGEISLFKKVPRFATATCETDANLLFIPHEDFKRFIRLAPNISYSMVRTIVSYLND